MMGAGDEDDFCPELPPHLLKKTIEVVSDEDFCPELPPHLQAKMKVPSAEEDMCPQLPPKMQSGDSGKYNFSCTSNQEKLLRKSLIKSSIDKCSKDQELEETSKDFCPELPLHLLEKSVADEFCPQLPPHLQKSIEHSSKDSSVSHLLSNSQRKAGNKRSSKSKTEFESPVQTHVEESVCSTSSGNGSEGEDESEQFCPALPPHLKKKSHRIIGPSLQPENYELQISHSDEDSDEEMGPVVGPLPAAEPVDMDRYIEETIARRTKSSTESHSGSNLAPARESWMLELPEDKPLFAGLGLQARQFARRAKTDRGDTSIWTDTPVDKERKAQRAAERAAAGVEEPVTSKSSSAAAAVPGPEQIAAKERDDRLQEMVDQYNAKKRPAPLVDTHLAKKKAAGDETSLTGVGRERKPFSREDDLHVNKFDEAQKSTILKKARQLNDRFASGKTAKFL